MQFTSNEGMSNDAPIHECESEIDHYTGHVLFTKKRRVPGGYSHTLPIRVCAAQRGRDFEAPDLERGIHFKGVF